jgi:acetyltransferase-like isoleucine patch superfamily enzyme
MSTRGASVAGGVTVSRNALGAVGLVVAEGVPAQAVTRTVNTTNRFSRDTSRMIHSLITAYLDCYLLSIYDSILGRPWI